MLSKAHAWLLILAATAAVPNARADDTGMSMPQVAPAPAPAVDSTALSCDRPAAGSLVREPTNLYSKNGVLKVTLRYATSVGADGLTRFCYLTPEGEQAPTLHLQAGDRLAVTLKNDTPAAVPGSGMEMRINAEDVCGDSVMNSASTNLHFHGTHTSVACHQDEVLYTTVNPGQAFQYSLEIPKSQSPGLYWYHPHIHGMSESAVLGGASGAIIIDGLEKAQPAVAGLPSRVLMIRDNLVPGQPTPGGLIPPWDLSLNFVPVPYPNYPRAVLQMQPNGRELWRVVNAAADTILDLQLQYDGVAQPLHLVALDGVPTGSHDDGRSRGAILTVTHIYLPAAGRAEFIVDGPGPQVKDATLLTLKVDTGPLGDNDLQRPIAQIQTSLAAAAAVKMPMVAAGEVFAAGSVDGLLAMKPTATRKLFFSEVLSDPSNPASQTDFYITLDGKTPEMFHMGMEPAVTTTQGAVEDWVIENRAGETHEFHMHQVHMLLLERNGVPVPAAERQYMDTIPVDYWVSPNPYPSIKVRIDFRNVSPGDSVYHCHLLGHEDNGMMAVIRVKAAL